MVLKNFFSVLLCLRKTFHATRIVEEVSQGPVLPRLVANPVLARLTSLNRTLHTDAKGASDPNSDRVYGEIHRKNLKK